MSRCIVIQAARQSNLLSLQVMAAGSSSDVMGRGSDMALQLSMMESPFF